MLPSDYGSAHPTTGDTAHQHHTGPIVDPSTKLLDPLVALAACASVTTQLRLATGIFILPLRHPLLTARMTLTLQDASGGRFLLGVGSGWLEEEFRALAMPFDDRAARMDETLAILRRAWRQDGDTFSSDGPLFEFDRVQLSPEPVTVPLILGGNTDRALRRARRSRRRMVQLRDTVARRRRPTPPTAWYSLREASGADGEFPIYVRMAKPDQADLARYEAEGFEHVLGLGRPTLACRGPPGREASCVRRGGRRTSVLRQRFVKYFLRLSRIWSAVLCQTKGCRVVVPGGDPGVQVGGERGDRTCAPSGAASCW